MGTESPLELADLAITLLEGLLNFGPTVERYNLMGSAQRRRALLSITSEERRDALIRTAYAYSSAARMQAEQTGDPDAYATDQCLDCADRARLVRRQAR